MKIIVQPKGNKNFLATVIIGQNYLSDWEKFAFPLWNAYCIRHGLGLIIFDAELINIKDKFWKKANWQKMLIGVEMIKNGLLDANVCYLDTDILISPFAPNLFNTYDKTCIALVSEIKNLPFSLRLAQKRLAFLRHTRWSSEYPLDSALFKTPEDIFSYHGFQVFDDYACTGFFIFNTVNHSEMLSRWFNKYQSGIETITGGGEEPILNYELLNWGKIQWYPYEFQALWIYEAAIKYPFIFDLNASSDLIKKCIEASLHSNHILHFAGSWNECQMWKLENFFEEKETKEEVINFQNYLNKKITGEAVGMIRPKN